MGLGLYIQKIVLKMGCNESRKKMIIGMLQKFFMLLKTKINCKVSLILVNIIDDRFFNDCKYI